VVLFGGDEIDGEISELVVSDDSADD